MSATPHPVTFGSELDTFVRQRQQLSALDEVIAERYVPLLGRRVLEVGCGAGVLTKHLLPGRDLVVSIDVDSGSVQFVRERFASDPHLVCVQADITQPAGILDGYALDSAISINVLEHIEDDTAALRALASLLPSGGVLVTVVPAGQWLYGTLDRSVGHYRRYDAAVLRNRLTESGFAVERMEHFNRAGMLGWYLNGRAFNRSSLPGWQLNAFNRLTRPLLALESLLPLPFGLSLVAVACRS